MPLPAPRLAPVTTTMRSVVSVNVSPRLGPACHWYAAGTARSVIPPRRYSMIDVAAAPCPRGARRLPTLTRQWRRSQPTLPANGSPTADRVAGAGPLHSVSWGARVGADASEEGV